MLNASAHPRESGDLAPCAPRAAPTALPTALTALFSATKLPIVKVWGDDTHEVMDDSGNRARDCAERTGDLPRAVGAARTQRL